jgi:hypothetical protein
MAIPTMQSLAFNPAMMSSTTPGIIQGMLAPSRSTSTNYSSPMPANTYNLGSVGLGVMPQATGPIINNGAHTTGGLLQGFNGSSPSAKPVAYNPTPYSGYNPITHSGSEVPQSTISSPAVSPYGINHPLGSTGVNAPVSHPTTSSGGSLSSMIGNMVQGGIGSMMNSLR